MKESFCIKGDTGMTGAEMKKYLDTVEDLRDGKKNAKKRLYKYVEEGKISIETYNELIERYATFHRINREKRDRETSQKIKDVLFGVMAFVVLIGSMASTLGYVVVHYGKGTAAWYFIIWLWAFNYVISIDSKKIRELEQENRQLKDKIDS